MKALLFAAVIGLFAATGAGALDSAPFSHADQPGNHNYVSNRTCGGTTVYENGNTDIYTASGNEFTDWSQADDFQVASNATICGAECDWFDTNENTGWDGTIEWTIYLDAGGYPGAVHASGVGSNSSTNSLGNYNGWDWFNTCFEFGQNVALTGGQRYWIAFHFTTSGCDYRYGIYLAYSTSQAFNYSEESSDCATGWVNVSNVDRAFSLFECVATPVTESTWGQVKSLYR